MPCSATASNDDGLKNGLVKVTGGLGTAFDTTYLALVISVILAFPLNVCERNEDRLLSQIDGVVREAVMALQSHWVMEKLQRSLSVAPSPTRW